MIFSNFIHFIKRFFYYTCTITTCTLLACAIWSYISCYSKGVGIDEASLSVAFLWQPLIVGSLTAFVSSVLMIDTEMSKKEVFIRSAIHYFCINLIVLVCGYLFEWYYPTLSQIVLMAGTIFIVYFIVYFSSYAHAVKIADEINDKLKNFHEDKM